MLLNKEVAMGYYNNKGHFFSEEESLEHRAKYGTANSVTDEKGTDNKKNNSSEYNHKYYEGNKEKWKDNKKSSKKKSTESNKKQNMSDDDDLFYDPVTGKARFGHKDYDENDPDFKRTDGRKIGDSGLTVFKNSNGSTIVLGKGVKFSFPPGTKITSAMEKRLEDIEKGNDGKNKESYVAKMLNAVTGFAARQKLKDPGDGKAFKNNDETNNKKKSSKKKSSKKKSSKKKTEGKEKQETTKKDTKNTRSFDEVAADYYQEKGKKLTEQVKKQVANKTTTKPVTKSTSTKKTTKKKVKHFDENGAIIRYFDRR